MLNTQLVHNDVRRFTAKEGQMRELLFSMSLTYVLINCLCLNISKYMDGITSCHFISGLLTCSSTSDCWNWLNTHEFKSPGLVATGHMISPVDRVCSRARIRALPSQRQPQPTQAVDAHLQTG